MKQCKVLVSRACNSNVYIISTVLLYDVDVHTPTPIVYVFMH